MNSRTKGIVLISILLIVLLLSSVAVLFGNKYLLSLKRAEYIEFQTLSLNIFRNSSQQAISSPAVFRSLSNDIYITVKFIDEDSYKLIVRNNYGILIMWIGLFISSISFIPRLKKRV